MNLRINTNKAEIFIVNNRQSTKVLLVVKFNLTVIFESSHEITCS